MILLLSAAYAAGPRCEHVGVAGLVPEGTGPAIVVLGHRPRVEADQRKADKVVRTLARRGAPVVLAVQVLPEVEPEWASIDILLEVPLGGRKPPEATLAVPPVYIHALADALGEGPMPPELESRFVEQVAWIDQQLASKALESWNGQGFLVVLVDRLHVQGGLGVEWQLARMTETPVSAALLADAGARCVESDRVLRLPLFRRATSSRLLARRRRRQGHTSRSRCPSCAARRT